MDLTEFLALAEKATRGPWGVRRTTTWSGCHTVRAVDARVGEDDVAIEMGEDDAAFITASRDLAPRLAAFARDVLSNVARADYGTDRGVVGTTVLRALAARHGLTEGEPR